MEPKFIADRITELRLAKNVSEYRMSMELGKSLGYVQAITSGRSMPSMEQLFNIIDYFEMTPAEFFQPEYQASPVLCSAIHILRGLGEESVKAVLPLLERVAELERVEMKEEGFEEGIELLG